MKYDCDAHIDKLAMAITRNNSTDSKVNIGVLVEPELFEKFDTLVNKRCLQKTRALRRLISDFVESEQFQSEQG